MASQRSRPVNPALLASDPEIEGHRAAVEELQSALRAEVPGQVWEMYVQLEKASQDLTLSTVDSLVRWAFREGVQAAQAMRANDGSTK